MTFIVKSRKFADLTVEIDDKDWPKVKEFNWTIQQYCGNLSAIVTILKRGKKQRALKLHRFIIGESNIPSGCDIYHKDGNVLNNKRSNLKRGVK